MNIACSKILTEQGFVNGVLQVEQGYFKRIIPKEQFHETIDVDYSDKMIIPGLIDIHLHGFGGFVDYNSELSEQEFINFLTALGQSGTTACLPSIKTWNYPAVANLKAPNNVSRFLGLSIEGTFATAEYSFFKEQFGQVPSLTNELFADLIEKSNHQLKYVMIAPELPNAQNVMRYLKSQGIKVSAGHTLMSATDFKMFNQEKLVDALTHTGNNMGQMHQRDVKVMGVGLLDPDIYCEIITDFIHLSAEMIAIIIKVSGINRTIMVSDSIVFGGCKPGVYYIKDMPMTVTEDFRVLDKDGWIQGSYFCLYQNFKKLVESGLATVEEAVLMASSNPAKFLGVFDQIGSIKENKKADFLVIDNQYQLIQSYISGEKAASIL